MKKIIAIAALTVVTASLVIPTMANQTQEQTTGVMQSITKHEVSVQINSMEIDNEKGELRVQVQVEDQTGVVKSEDQAEIQVDFLQDIWINGEELNTGALCTNQTVTETTAVWDMVYPLEQKYTDTVEVDFDVKQVRTKGNMIMDKWKFDIDVKAE